MAKNRKILLVALVIIGSVGLLWLVSRPREPIYQGRDLTFWLDQYGSNHWSNTELDREAEFAIRHFGTNCIPAYLQMISTHPSSLTINFLARIPPRWSTRLHILSMSGYASKLQLLRRRGSCGLAALGADAKTAVPALITLLNDPHSDVRYVSVYTIRCLGPVARDALPSVIKCLNDPEFTVRDDAVAALGTLHEDPEKTVPLLIDFLDKNRNNQFLRQDALGALGQFGGQAASAVPAVRPFLNHEDSYTRQIASNVLWKIDPQAAAKLEVK
jgi:hypothetical protein